ncbi:MAG TPA: signal recognition particle-docking protein FtsY [Thermoleophilia bacterium]|nr:signal recognition particle-docking protein FtsY [Thermoleophilia bacterium]
MEWHEAFKGVSAQAETAIAAEEERERAGLFRRFRQNLGKARDTLRDHFRTILFDRLDQGVWEQVEEALIFADVGVDATVKIVEQLEQRAAEGGIESREQLQEALADVVGEMLSPPDPEDQLIDVASDPSVILVVGVNGTGKTTTIGKLAYRLHQLGKSPLMVAADTFRAAAVEQLSEWAARVGCEIVKQAQGSDPAAVVYDGIAAARSRGHDVVIVDTAGRLHTQVNLMRELEKVRRVVEKQVPAGPAETLLVIDATTGQNGLRQAEVFREAVDVTGIVLTKLDGTAKGGIVIAIHETLGIPIKLIGVGEKLEDLRPFDARQFARAVFGSDSVAV